MSATHERDRVSGPPPKADIGQTALSDRSSKFACARPLMSRNFATSQMQLPNSHIADSNLTYSATRFSAPPPSPRVERGKDLTMRYFTWRASGPRGLIGGSTFCILARGSPNLRTSPSRCGLPNSESFRNVVHLIAITPGFVKCHSSGFGPRHVEQLLISSRARLDSANVAARNRSDQRRD
jgi:hypothetical protein